MAKRKATLEPRALTPSGSGKYLMILQSVGNPDFGQYAPVSDPAAVKGDTLKAMVNAAEDYRDFWNLGGGNWVAPEVRLQDGTPVAWISYNGRVWDGPDSCAGANEIKDLT